LHERRKLSGQNAQRGRNAATAARGAIKAAALRTVPAHGAVWL